MNPNIHKEGINTRFSKENQPENRGRKRKSLSDINKKLTAEGVKEISKEEFYEVIGKLMLLTMEELKVIGADKEVPAVIRWVIKGWQHQKTRHKLISEYRDWVFRKKEDEVNVTLIDYAERNAILAEMREKALADKKIRDNE